MSAGRVITPASTATSMTALAGTLVLLTLDQIDDPGIAPSRLNAKVIREAVVRHATVQNSWPAAEMKITIVCDVVPSAWPKMTSEPYRPWLMPAVTASWSCTAKRKASSRIQPPTAL